MAMRQETRRAFTLGVFNGTLFEFAERLIDPPLVLTWFVNQLTPSNLLAGLVAPMSTGGWFLPQLFISGRVQRMERKMPSYILAAVIRSTSWLLLGLGVWLVDDPRLLLVSFFVLYAVARLASGLSGLAFFDIVGKTIPARRRGSFFAWRQLLGGALGLGAGWVVNVVLKHPALPFPHGHAFLFFLYFALIVPALTAFTFVREPPGAALVEPVGLRKQLRRARTVLYQNGVYRRYMSARLMLGLAGISLPFYGIYAKNVLHAADGMVGVYVGVRVAALLLFNLLWGSVSDRRGNRLVMRLLLAGNALTTLLALLMVAAVNLLQLRGSWLPFLALPLFVLDGAMRPAQVMVGSNFLLELAPEEERPLYLGFSNTLMGVAVLLSGLGGLLVDGFGFGALFAVSLALYLSGYALAGGLPEPRAGMAQEENERKHVDEQSDAEHSGD